MKKITLMNQFNRNVNLEDENDDCMSETNELFGEL